ncbi:TetR/AcrR family transcriptional regulator [Streptacidiphilus sp. ASG 303]|uniref:TetR/AcrR family transcriptional regulator n=1 Tax=Streptacidiphilus sp. ASG 303 TaxID=2896847 RepID=UPI001E604E2B|nr:TetR/AcrR family transcriptional regulator [Streptacidiphilus sp. ASG 303]MCD0482018.1 TetR/AcrR family transcriptional regulator [Streptacidiphilus sp. ASG 303]
MARTTTRMSAEERRESVVRAAMTEFARGGYLGTSTEAIARRVGVSQPYLFRLFPNKQAIFLAASRLCMERTRRAFEEAAEGVPDDRVAEAMGAAYTQLIADREVLLMQMQMYVAAATGDAAGEPEVGEAVRAGWAELWDWVNLRLGAEPGAATDFMAHGMLINVLLAMGFPPDHRVWAGFGPDCL